MSNPYSLSTIPADYKFSFDQIAPNFTDYAQAQAVQGETWWESALRALPTLVMANHQRELLKVQLDRARQGLPPLQSTEYGLGVNVGIDASTRTALIVGGVALVAVLLLARR
jgi:hypothetical protein